MGEFVAYGVYGPLGFGESLHKIREGIKSTAIYRDNPTKLNWDELQRNLALVSAHGSQARFEVPFEKRSPIYSVPFGPYGPLWHQMKKIRVPRLAGKIGVSRNIFFPPLHHGAVSLKPPTEVQETAVLELLTADESLDRFLPKKETREGDVMIVTTIGEAALEDIKVGFGETQRAVFDPTKLRQRLGRAIVDTTTGFQPSQPPSGIILAEPAPVILVE